MAFIGQLSQETRWVAPEGGVRSLTIQDAHVRRLKWPGGQVPGSNMVRFKFKIGPSAYLQLFTLAVLKSSGRSTLINVRITPNSGRLNVALNVCF